MTKNNAKATVLVVDDNADAVEALAQILEYEGFNVVTALDGREALDYLRTSPLPDLILLDLMMPVMDGWQVRRELANTPMLASMPVIVMTALAGGAQIDADAIIAKPIDLKRLLQVMDELLGRREDSQGSPDV
jgi:CheY-like chemotaxis protein